jgi:hypothetical protein
MFSQLGFVFVQFGFTKEPMSAIHNRLEQCWVFNENMKIVWFYVDAIRS